MKYLTPVVVIMAVFLIGCGREDGSAMLEKEIPFMVSFRDDSFMGPLGTHYSLSDSWTEDSQEVKFSVHCKEVTPSSAIVVFSEHAEDGSIMREETLTVPLDATLHTAMVFDTFRFRLKRI
ncbi:MAG: hypothetical protein AAF546_07770 [Verrucomicrobiota bacterium]